MIPIQVNGNCVVVRRGGKEAGGVIRGLRDTNRIRGGAVWASQHAMTKPVVIKRPSRKCGRRAEKVVVLIRGDLHRCPVVPVSRFGVLGGTALVERPVLAVEKSAEAVVPAGIGVGWEGLNAKPSVRTFVLVAVAETAANPIVGLAGRV